MHRYTRANIIIATVLYALIYQQCFAMSNCQHFQLRSRGLLEVLQNAKYVRAIHRLGSDGSWWPIRKDATAQNGFEADVTRQLRVNPASEDSVTMFLYVVRDGKMVGYMAYERITGKPGSYERNRFSIIHTNGIEDPAVFKVMIEILQERARTDGEGIESIDFSARRGMTPELLAIFEKNGFNPLEVGDMYEWVNTSAVPRTQPQSSNEIPSLAKDGSHRVRDLLVLLGYQIPIATLLAIVFGKFVM